MSNENVKVAIRVRPFNRREIEMDSENVIEVRDKKQIIIQQPQTTSKNDQRPPQVFSFDACFWSMDEKDPNYSTQEDVFDELGTDIVDCAFEGYNACIFAYGQTGSGKTFTMMGSPGNEGLIPRICQNLFARMRQPVNSEVSFRTEVSYLEIYNERVKDLLGKNQDQNLKVREHPRLGPYVQDLSKHLVTDYRDIEELLIRGNARRTTAATGMNDTSSRSHAIFTIVFSQATFSSDAPRETSSKINLVDLAGSERAQATGK